MKKPLSPRGVEPKDLFVGACHRSPALTGGAFIARDKIRKKRSFVSEAPQLNYKNVGTRVKTVLNEAESLPSWINMTTEMRE